MEPRVYTWLDKSTWPAGPWHDEPDKEQYTDSVTGLPCLIRRNDELGHLCGYVGVAPSHPWYGKSEDGCMAGRLHCGSVKIDFCACGNSPASRTDVHGGLTYAAPCRHDPSEHGICHVPAPGEPDDVWWFGFDCAHVGDWSPGYRPECWPDESYRTWEYVRAQCEALAAQLAAVVA